MSAIILEAAGPAGYVVVQNSIKRDLINTAIRHAKQAETHMVPVCVLSKDEKLGLAVAAGVPVDVVDGKLVTAQPIGISRIAGQYHVYTKPG